MDSSLENPGQEERIQKKASYRQTRIRAQPDCGDPILGEGLPSLSFFTQPAGLEKGSPTTLRMFNS